MRRLGQREKELFHVGTVGRGVLAFEALFQSCGDDGKPGAIDGLGSGGQLGDNRVAVAAFLQHTNHRVDLSLGALEPVDDGLHGVRFKFHDGVPPGCWFSQLYTPGGFLGIVDGGF